MITRLKPIWRDALALLFAVWDARTPLSARLGALLALAYAVSPVDLIPDAVPLLGLGDDLLVVPAVLALAARALPAPVLLGARARSAACRGCRGCCLRWGSVCCWVRACWSGHCGGG